MQPTFFTQNTTEAIQPTLNALTIVSSSTTQFSGSITKQPVIFSNVTPIQFFSPVSKPSVRKAVTLRSSLTKVPSPVLNVTRPTGLHSPQFDDLSGFWAGQSRKDLIGWNKGSGQSRDELFQFSAAKDLALAGTVVDWVSDSFVKGELLKRAPTFKHAIATLLIQAESADHDVSLPPLLGDILAFIRKAAQMTEACGALEDEGRTN